MAPVIRNLGGLQGEVENTEEGRSYVGTQGFNGFGDDTTRDGFRIGVEGIESSLDF